MNPPAARSPVSFLAHVARLPKAGLPVVIDADAAQREQLAAEHGLDSVERFHAELHVTTWKRNGVRVEGRVEADIVQSCAVSAEDLPVQVRETLSFRFVPEARHDQPDEEVELDADELDEVEYTGTSLDVGEAVAQSLALAIDPFAVGPEAEAARQSGLLGDGQTGPFAGLKGLLKK